MPGFNPPVADWLPKRLGTALSDVATLKKQGTEYVVNGAQECVAIIGNLAFAPKPAAPGATPETEATGLVGWGIAVKLSTGWVSLGEDSGWIEPTLLNSWKNLGSGRLLVAYRKQGNTVRLQGSLWGGVTGSSVFVLPAGFRPTGQTFDASGGYNGTEGATPVSVVVSTDGTVFVYYKTTGTPEQAALDGITFTTD